MPRSRYSTARTPRPDRPFESGRLMARRSLRCTSHGLRMRRASGTRPSSPSRPRYWCGRHAAQAPWTSVCLRSLAACRRGSGAADRGWNSSRRTASTRGASPFCGTPRPRRGALRPRRTRFASSCRSSTECICLGAGPPSESSCISGTSLAPWPSPTWGTAPTGSSSSHSPANVLWVGFCSWTRWRTGCTIRCRRRSGRRSSSLPRVLMCRCSRRRTVGTRCMASRQPRRRVRREGCCIASTAGSLASSAPCGTPTGGIHRG